jgi:hypothetical protein
MDDPPKIAQDMKVKDLGDRPVAPQVRPKARNNL